MENSECCVGEDVSLTTDATDDSCITQFIEIVPIHISRKDFAKTVQVKDEFTADIKQEPEDLFEEYGASIANTVSNATNNDDWFERVDETHSHMKPAVVPEGINLTRLMSHVADVNTQSSISESCLEVKIEVDNNDITEHPHDDKPTPYVCTVCNIRFMSKHALNVHRKRHTGDNVYSCNECEKCFSAPSSLHQHMNIHRSKDKCTECGKCFASRGYLATHMRSHSGERPFECTVCNKRFTTSGSLVIHSRIHSGEKPFKCHMCDKSFSQSGSLKKHMRVHTGDKPYKCHICDKAFSESGHLNDHLRVHTGDKPYKCSLCNESFSRSNYLKTHQRREHSNIRPYDCRYCGKLFVTNVDLMQHVRTHWCKAVLM